MKEKTVFEYSREEVLELIQDDINKKKNKNHLLKLQDAFYFPDVVKMEIAMYNKDEVTH